jgi:NADPH-dependent glutamate synthase beta subunit-like oxidoreductase
MPANEVEIVASEHEGMNCLSCRPTRVLGDDQNKSPSEYLKMQLGEPDKSGRQPGTFGSETLLAVDMVISAIGQSRMLRLKNKTLTTG